MDVSKMSNEALAHPIRNVETSASKTNIQIESPTKSEDNLQENSDPSNQMWEVEKITRKRVHYGQPQWLVKWKGYPANASTWEPRESFVNDPDITYTGYKKGPSRKAKVSPYKGKVNSQKQAPKKKTKRKERRSRALQINDSSQEASNDTETCLLSGSYFVETKKNLFNDRESVCKSTVSATTVSTEETIEKVSVQRIPPHQTTKGESQFENPKVALESIVDEEDDDWRKNEVRIAVQNHIDHNRSVPEVVIPSDLDTEFIKKALSANLSEDHFSQTSLGRQNSHKNSIGNKSSLFNGFKTGDDDDVPWPVSQGVDYFSFSAKRQIQDFNFLQDPTDLMKSISNFNDRDNTDNDDIHYKCPSSVKKVCTTAERGSTNVFEYTIQKVDYYKRNVEVRCNYTINNEHFYTKWLSVEQSATICPQETINYLLNLSYANMLKDG